MSDNQTTGVPDSLLVPITLDAIAGHIYVVRGHRIMLDSALARLYHVTTSHLNKAVRRNRDRFPADFMFQLTDDEMADITNLTFQNGIATPQATHGGRRTLPYAFTQEGVAMLSGILHSPHAVAVNILIMRTFVRLRAAGEVIAVQHFGICRLREGLRI
jgi:hypothetical protein